APGGLERRSAHRRHLPHRRERSPRRPGPRARAAADGRHALRSPRRAQRRGDGAHQPHRPQLRGARSRAHPPGDGPRGRRARRSGHSAPRKRPPTGRRGLSAFRGRPHRLGGAPVPASRAFLALAGAEFVTSGMRWLAVALALTACDVHPNPVTAPGTVLFEWDHTKATQPGFAKARVGAKTSKDFVVTVAYEDTPRF